MHRPHRRFATGQVFEIEFPAFTPRIVLHSEKELTVEIVSGDNIGFTDTVACELAVVRDGLAVLSWQEHIGTTVVHVLDFICGRAYTVVAPAKGKFMRLSGRIRVMPETRPEVPA